MKAAVQSLPMQCQLQLARCGNADSQRQAVLLVHGWASSSAVWQGVEKHLQKHFEIYMLDLPGHGINRDVVCATLEEFFACFERDIEPLLPSSYAVLGWSLGGALASLLAQHKPGCINALVTVATNPEFVASDSWPNAMDRALFLQFSKALQKNHQATVSRFWALQLQGADSARKDLRWLKLQLNDVQFNTAGLQSTLSWLQQINLQDCWRALVLPSLHCYGKHDALVPGSLAGELAVQFPWHQFKLFDSSAHTPFISEQEAWLSTVINALQPTAVCRSSVGNSSLIDKRAVARSFSKAAYCYDDIASFQQAVGEQLLSRVDTVADAQLPHVLDLGSGTGYFTRHLAKRFSGAKIFGLDLAEGMLLQARRQNVMQVQADIESLPFDAQVFDFIYANLSLQWCELFQAVLFDIKRCLKTGGRLAFTTILEGSLSELNAAWRQVDSERHINPFANEQTLETQIQTADMDIAVWQVREHKEYFSSANDLIKSVRGIGAGNHMTNRSSAMMRKENYNAFIKSLESQHDTQGRLSLSYRILYVVLTKKAIVKP